jgi:hypothetical protein
MPGSGAIVKGRIRLSQEAAPGDRLPIWYRESQTH